jgi:hypothetical protein
MWRIIRSTPDARPGQPRTKKTEMRYPTHASEPAHRRLRVPPSPLHDPSVQELHDESSWRRETVRCALDWGHQRMGYRTPNIDRIAQEGAIFTDAYGQQSCTAGRASFILSQEPFRTGLLTIGMPGDPHGIQDWMPSRMCSRRRATPPRSSGKTILATVTSICPPNTASTNSTAISTTSTPKRSPKAIFIRRTRIFEESTDHAA